MGKYQYYRRAGRQTPFRGYLNSVVDQILNLNLVYVENMSLVPSSVAAAQNTSNSLYRARDDLDYMYVKVSIGFPPLTLLLISVQLPCHWQAT